MCRHKYRGCISLKTLEADCYISRSSQPARHSPFPRSSLASPHSSPFPRAPQPPLTSPPYAPASPRSPPYTPASPPYTPAALRSPPYSAGDEVVYARPGPGLGARSLTQVSLFIYLNTEGKSIKYNYKKLTTISSDQRLEVTLPHICIQGELRRATLDGERVADPDRILKKVRLRHPDQSSKIG